MSHTREVRGFIFEEEKIRERLKNYHSQIDGITPFFKAQHICLYFRIRMMWAEFISRGETVVNKRRQTAEKS